jgi:hypothetical protein
MYARFGMSITIGHRWGGTSGTDGGRSSKIFPLRRWCLHVNYWKTNHEVKPSCLPPKTGTGRPSVAVRNVIKNNSQAEAAAVDAGTVYDVGISATITSDDDYNDEGNVKWRMGAWYNN